MKRLFLLSLLSLLTVLQLQAQQWFNLTGYPSWLYHYNPAYTGTRGDINAKVAYRKQWVGFDGAPVTQVAGMDARLWKGRIGVGGILYKDETGPTKRNEYNLDVAYHLHFPDVEFCAGFSVDFMRYFVDGSLMTTHWTSDPAAYTGTMDMQKIKNTDVGLMLYNDRFHFGLSCMTFLDNHMEFFTEVDTSHKGIVSLKPHYYFNCGYNFDANPDYVWENNIMATYVAGLPMTIDYNLRLHYRDHMIFGAGWRLKDALDAQVGCVFLGGLMALYSYDIGINKLHGGHNGSHEFMLGYRYSFSSKHGGYKNFGLFQHQRYNLF